MNTLETKNKETLSRTCLWIIVMVAIILGVGYFSFVVVADKGVPTWDYRPVKSLPSESPYAVYPKNPQGQHVSGKEGK
ncbi:hypothetical protein DO021_11180 [Desulfobacter hydrogenophilus]|uniref:Uncharacterized protein n=1 Tax=Desulfobacter hydrogenophilus TaxID=2291 RepID=A0A328FG42_9BACT|nr:hypothetical protein [Desulfobacter hydrogenophilus]NDY72076.1 hypothetical protein [Desulfobacter hydrogenophilus]QBH11496.1 hypothetical protein EYB58_00285 [Desulfobacter hydrogenophilus]RAM01995.1 hypothetical protein DO021_11180 [Desulfobacter hydrogenophilus]